MTNPDRDEGDIITGFDLDKRRDVQIIQRCLNLCSLFNMTGDDLVNSWLAYSFNNKIDDNITLPLLDTLERHLHEENQKKFQKESLTTPKSSPMPLLRSRNAVVSPMAVTQTQRLTSLQSPMDAALSVKAHPIAKFSSPIPRSRSQVPAGFMSPSMLGSPPAPSGPWAQRTNRGRVIQALNLELNDFKPVSREDRSNLSIEFDSKSWSDNFLYMFQPEDVVDRILEQREDALLEEILTEQLEGQTIASLQPVNVASASEVIYGGSIWTYNSASKIHITDTWLRRHDQKVLLTLPTNETSHWGFFPGMVCVLRGFNPTGNNMLVKEVYIPKILPSPAPMITSSPAEISIILAAGPFTFNSDLAYSPLGDLLEEVKKRAPTLLILSGPFFDIDSDTPTPKMYTEHREELWNFISEQLHDVETRVITVPHIREAHHFPCFPQPSIIKTSQKMDSKIVHLPNPCIFTIGHIKLCVMSHDIVFHLAGNEISKIVAGAQANRISRLCTYLLHQRSLYPLLLPPANASIDWTHMSKFNLDSLPDIFLMPSQLGQYARTAGNSVFVNPGQLVKGAQSPGTFARIVAHSDSAPIDERVRVEIVRI